MQQKTQTKQTQTKQTQTKAKTLYYKALLVECLAGKLGSEIQRFYVNAIAYHTKQKTAFPRARLADVELMKIEEAKSFLEKHKATSIPAGSKQGQKLFDQMMIEAKAK